MKSTQVLFVSRLSEDAQMWAYGLGKHGIYSMTATMEDVAAETSIVDCCTLAVVDIDGSFDQMLSFCRYLRSVFAGPILLLTYERDERFHLRLYQAGVDECITKPIGIPLALAKFMSWLRTDHSANGSTTEMQLFQRRFCQ